MFPVMVRHNKIIIPTDVQERIAPRLTKASATPVAAAYPRV